MAQTWSIEAFAEEVGGGFIGNLINNSNTPVAARLNISL